MVSCEPIIIDCYGHASSTSLDVVCSGVPVQFKFADQKSAGVRAHVGLYVDYTATAGRDYLRYPKSRRVALLCEPNASLPFAERPELAGRFALVMTHDARLLERGAPYVELPYGTSFVEHLLTNPPSITKSRLVSMIGAPHPEAKGGHALRNQVIESLKSRGGVDQFGRGIRWIDTKLDGLADYAFSIAMENASRDFYFTEKVIDCFLTDTVPIYWGCPGISRYFDPRGILHFQSLAQLEQILCDLSWDQYAAMLPYIRKNKELAVTKRLATRPQLFERVGVEILNQYGKNLSPSRSTVFGFGLSLWRRLRRRHAKP